MPAELAFVGTQKLIPLNAGETIAWRFDGVI
jgi:hypothetical protein